MKKLLLGLLILLVTIAFCGCSVNSGVSVGGFTYDHADRYQAGNFSYQAQDVRQVVVHYVSGRVEFVPSGNAQLTVQEEPDSLSEEQQMHWLLDDGVLHIEFCQSGARFTLREAKRLTVQVPEHIALEAMVTSGEIQLGNHHLLSLDAQCTSGAIQTGIIQAEHIILHATSGNMNTGALRAGTTLSARNTSGAIRIENATAETMHLTTTSGSITTGPLDASHHLEAAATSGSITIEALKTSHATINSTSGPLDLGLYQCGPIDIGATSGNVALHPVLDAGLSVTFTTNSGTLNGKKGSGQYTLGDGASPVSVSTTSGALTVREKTER